MTVSSPFSSLSLFCLVTFRADFFFFLPSVSRIVICLGVSGQS